MLSPGTPHHDIVRRIRDVPSMHHVETSRIKLFPPLDRYSWGRQLLHSSTLFTSPVHLTKLHSVSSAFHSQGQGTLVTTAYHSSFVCLLDSQNNKCVSASNSEVIYDSLKSEDTSKFFHPLNSPSFNSYTVLGSIEVGVACLTTVNPVKNHFTITPLVDLTE